MVTNLSSITTASTDYVPQTNSLKSVYSDDADTILRQQQRWRRLVREFQALYSMPPVFVARSPGRVNIIGEHIDYSLYGVLPMALAQDVLVAVAIADDAGRGGVKEEEGEEEEEEEGEEEEEEEEGEGNVPTFELANVDRSKFPPCKFTLERRPRHNSGNGSGGEYVPSKWNLEIDAEKMEWSNYFKAGLKGALDYFSRLDDNNNNNNNNDNNNINSSSNDAKEAVRKRRWRRKPRSMKILVDGDVPLDGGLSSSAALTTASALAVLYANSSITANSTSSTTTTAISKSALTTLAIASERLVGVNSGGMDQSASVYGARDALLFVSFFPRLRAVPVALPQHTSPELTVLVAQSLVRASKRETAPVNYNLRVVECALAAAWLDVAVLGRDGAGLEWETESPLGISLRGFHRKYFASRAAATGTRDGDAKESLDDELRREEQELAELEQLTRATLTQEQGYSRQEIADFLGCADGVSGLESRFMPARFPVRVERFKLRQRAEHVFAEAGRVLRFLRLLRKAAAQIEPAGDTSHDHEQQQQQQRQVLANPCTSSSDLDNADAAHLPQALGALLDASQASCRDLFECSCAELDRMCVIARRAGSLGSRLTGAGWGGATVHLIARDRLADVERALKEEYYDKLDLGGGSETDYEEAGVDEDKEQQRLRRREERLRLCLLAGRPECGSVIFVINGEDGLGGITVCVNITRPLAA